MKPKTKAVFLDRDGTLIFDAHYLSVPEKLRLYKNTPRALSLLADAGYKFFIVSNQSGIGRGYFTRKDADAVNKELLRQLKVHGVKIETVYYCPHTPEDNCDCRKPKPKMGLEIIKRYNVDVENSYVIGDHKSDIDFGINIGVKPIFVRTGHGLQELRKYKGIPGKIIVKDIFSAALRILNR